MYKGTKRILLGIATIFAALAVSYVSRNFIFNFVFGPHRITLSDVRYPDPEIWKTLNLKPVYISASGRIHAVSVNHVYESMGSDKAVPVNYCIITGPESEIALKTSEELPAEGSRVNYSGLIGNLSDNKEDGEIIGKEYKDYENFMPSCIIDAKTDLGSKKLAAKFLLVFPCLAFLFGCYLLVSGLFLLRKR